MRFADVIVDISAHALDRTFQYRVPDRLQQSCDIGSVVAVPFGKRKVTGYIVGFSDRRTGSVHSRISRRARRARRAG